MVNLSKASKMPCPSWSLPAITTCPGARGDDGELVPACAGCYATTGNYHFPNVQRPRQENMTAWQHPEWSGAMVDAIGKSPYFRWFDSGDMYSLSLARKIADVIAHTPDTRHWLPTRQYKFKKFIPLLKSIAKINHAVVRYSSDSIHGEIIKAPNSSVIFDAERQDPPAGAFVCPAYSQGGKCRDCRACWDKSIPVIAYPQHGRKMAAVNLKLSNNPKIIARG